MKLFVVILSLFILCSCGGIKKTTEKNSEIIKTEKTEKKKDSTSKTETNQEIKDRITIPISVSQRV